MPAPPTSLARADLPPANLCGAGVGDDPGPEFAREARCQLLPNQCASVLPHAIGPAVSRESRCSGLSVADLAGSPPFRLCPAAGRSTAMRPASRTPRLETPAWAAVSHLVVSGCPVGAAGAAVVFSHVQAPGRVVFWRVLVMEAVERCSRPPGTIGAEPGWPAAWQAAFSDGAPQRPQ